MPVRHVRTRQHYVFHVHYLATGLLTVGVVFVISVTMTITLSYAQDVLINAVAVRVHLLHSVSHVQHLPSEHYNLTNHALAMWDITMMGRVQYARYA